MLFSNIKRITFVFFINFAIKQKGLAMSMTT